MEEELGAMSQETGLYYRVHDHHVHLAWYDPVAAELSLRRLTGTVRHQCAGRWRMQRRQLLLRHGLAI